jgi:hypothetical protein
MLDKVREALRITHNKLDIELQDVIDACKADLKIAGITKLDDSDALIQQAVKTYVKAEYEQDTSKAMRLTQAYLSLKISLCLCGEYTEV